MHEVLDLPTLVAYISYAKKHIHPELTDEAAEELTRRYVQMRQRGNTPGSRKKVLTSCLDPILYHIVSSSQGSKSISKVQGDVFCLFILTSH